MKEYFEIFVTFFRVGLFTFGGGYAMLPIAEREVITKKEWITQDQLIDYYGIAQVSMGIIAINTCALIGYQIKGKQGAALAAFASATPSIIIITIIALVLENFMGMPLVMSVFSAIRVGVTALIVNTAIKLAKKGIIDKKGLLLFLISFVSITFLGINPIILIVFSSLFGIVLFNEGGHTK